MREYVPTEAEEQEAVIEWAKAMEARVPELELLHHIPNGGRRSKAEAGRFKAQGVKAGVPDLSLPVPRGRYHGLYVEMKRKRGGRISPEQEWWIERLQKQGYFVDVCFGADEAIRRIEWYLTEAK